MSSVIARQTRAQKGRCRVHSHLSLAAKLVLASALISIPGESAARHYGYGYRSYAGRYAGPYGYIARPYYRSWGYGGYRPYYAYRPYYGGYYGYAGPTIFIAAMIPPPPPVYVVPLPPPPPPVLPPPPQPVPIPQAAPAPPAAQCAPGSTMDPGGYCESVPVPSPERG
ncbi:hypothetical protein [Sphingomonas hankyongi]|uniref:Uncharacterized protein n=1 Tax=Sphingomonas hankyongi TaxID=2908209 RepID=A0ABT0S4V7_9SPHN|nr:hypothetical protein [Sphingomonas hankyongi]MCL6730885.1 hypothetical protein [Sphingomonas hankyongi]